MKITRIGLSVLLAGFTINSGADIVGNLLQDPGFEAITGNEPNATTAPWLTVGEGAAGSFISTTTQAHSGSQSALFGFYYDGGTIAQTTGVQIEAGKDYEMSIWMLIDSLSGTAAHTNNSSLNLTLAASAAVDGTYGYRIAQFGNIPTVVGEWQQFTRVFTAAQLTDWVGEYIQVRYVKQNDNTQYKIYIDDASFGVVIPEPATLGLVTVIGAAMFGIRRMMML